MVNVGKHYMDPMGMLVSFRECSRCKMLFQLMVPRMGGGDFFPQKILGLFQFFSSLPVKSYFFWGERHLELLDVR